MVDYMPLLGTPLRTVTKIEGYLFSESWELGLTEKPAIWPWL